jgi:hypothetical protein
MNEANHVIISAILKSEHRHEIEVQSKILTANNIEQFINKLVNYETMSFDAKEFFDYMYNECIDVNFIQRKLEDIKNEENDY